MESDDQDYMESGSGVMVSNLPLVFSRGSPSSLYEMSEAELEVFVPFMVRCSLGEERPVPWSQLPRPSWWPRKLPFRMPTTSNTTATRSALVGLVERCYMFHGCEYLLKFCISLVVQMPPSGYRFNDNRDGTTSMYHGSTGKLLVTFRNENRDYDKFSYDGRNRDSTKKLLLSPSPHTGERKGTNGTTAIVQPSSTEICLCDKCENEFYSLQEVKKHEKHCSGDKPSSPVIPSPEPELVDDEPEPAGQVPFLAYFNLQPAKHTGIEPYMSPRKKCAPSPPRKLPGPIYPRYDSIPISSPLGKFLLGNSKLRNKCQASQHFVMRYERHLHATPNTDVNFSRERCTNRWIVVWRPGKEEQPWVHLYCFTRAQKLERLITISTGLDRSSRRLLRMCHPLKVKLKRLQKRLVDRMMRLGGPTAPCIDLTEENQIDSRLDGCSAVLANNGLPNFRAEPWGNNLEQMYINDNLLNLKVSSSGKTVDSVPWTDGLQQGPGNTFVPGVSGILNSGGLFNNNVTPKHTAQLGISELNPNATSHQGALKLIPLSCPGNQEISADPPLVFQSVNKKTQIAKVNSKIEFNQSLILPADESGFSVKHNSSPTADISLIPLNSSTQCKTSNSKVNSDILKPLSKKKYGTRDPHSTVQGHKRSEQSSNNSEVPSGLVFRSSGNYEGKKKHLTPSQSQSMLKGNQKNYSHVVPNISEKNSSVPFVNANVPLSNISHTGTNSSIEIIDLSSDEDDVRDRRQSEADNAPQQLDGLACYPHTGAKVPDSSSYSLPKNGNSHWSSKQKSHCGAGCVGDLATNGQPPNVPPNTTASPVLHTLFLPLCNVPMVNYEGQQIQSNCRKRKNEEPACGGGKTLILDISNDRLKTLNQKEISTVSTSSKICKSPEKDNSMNLIPDETVPAIPEELKNICPTPLPTPSATFLNVSDLSKDFENKQYSKEKPRRFMMDEDSSVKSPLQINENLSISPSVKCIEKGCENSEEQKVTVKVIGTGGKIIPNETPVSGFISNTLNTVDKSVDLLKSVVLTGGNRKLKYNFTGNSTSDKNSLSKLHKHVSLLGKPLQGKNNAKWQNEGVHRGRSRNKCYEVRRLLKDECRELTQKGLRELRCLNLQDARLTRGSVDRIVSSRIRRKSNRLKYTGGLDSTNKLKIKFVNMSKMVTTSSCNINTSAGFKRFSATYFHQSSSSMVSKDCISGSMDENGNSAPYLKLLANRVSNKNSRNSRGAKNKGFNKVLENKRKCDKRRVSKKEKEHIKLSNEKSLCIKQHSVSYNDKLLKNTDIKTLAREKVNFIDEYSASGNCIEDASSSSFVERKWPSTSHRQLYNLAHGNWKEMLNRSQLKNVGPLLKNIGHLGYHMSRQEESQMCVTTAHDSSQVKEQEESLKINSRNTLIRELKSLVQDECKEMSRMGFHPSRFALPGIKRALLNKKRYGKYSVKGKALVTKKDLPTTQLKARPEFMNGTEVECSAIPAHASSLKKTQNSQHSEALEVILKPDLRTSKMMLNYVEKCGQGSNTDIENNMVQTESNLQPDSVVQPKSSETKSKHRNHILKRELNNLGKDEWKELRGTGFHPSDIVGSDVKYLNASSDEDGPLCISKTKSSIKYSKLEKLRNSHKTVNKGRKKVKMNRELFRLMNDECKELKQGRKYLQKSKKRFRRCVHNKVLKTQVRCKSTTLLSRGRRSEQSVFVNVSGKKRVPQMRSTRSQSKGCNSGEVFTQRNSHRQILHTETAMCVLNYILPNIN